MRVLAGALLGLLAREPLSGTELNQQLQHRLGAAWRAGHSQIYPELARLEGEGAVSHEVLPQPDRPAMKRYALTEQGLGRLRAWASEPGEVSAVRDELAVKTYSLWLVNPVAAAAVLAAHERHHARRLAFYEGLLAELERAWDAEGGALGSPLFASVALVRRGLGYEREYTEWCRWVRARLARAPTTPGAPA